MSGSSPKRVLAAALVWLAAATAGPEAAHAHGDEALSVDETTALTASRAAIGRTLRDASFLDAERRAVRLADLRGRPVVVNLIYTACIQTCPLIVGSLRNAVTAAEGALGVDGFSVVTIGFDTVRDTPRRMRAYARERGIDAPNWHFLSADAETIHRLTEDLGFVYFRSPKGFDHLAQITLIDGEGVVRRQIYGETFEPPALVEPLKELALGRSADLTDLDGIIERVRIFCTFYDPLSGRYRFDYSIIIGIAIGAASLLAVGGVLAREWWRGRPGSHA